MALSLVPPQPNQPEPRPVPILPVATNWIISQAPGPDGHMAVVVQIQTPIGTLAFFLPAPVAVQIGDQMHRTGQAGDLVLPG